MKSLWKSLNKYESSFVASRAAARFACSLLLIGSLAACHPEKHRHAAHPEQMIVREDSTAASRKAEDRDRMSEKLMVLLHSKQIPLIPTSKDEFSTFWFENLQKEEFRVPNMVKADFNGDGRLDMACHFKKYIPEARSTICFAGWH